MAFLRRREQGKRQSLRPFARSPILVSLLALPHLLLSPLQGVAALLVPPAGRDEEWHFNPFTNWAEDSSHNKIKSRILRVLKTII